MKKSGINYPFLYSLFLLLFSLSSCASINTAVLGAVTGPGFATKTKKTLAKTIELIDSTETRSVVIVPMIHIGAEKDYEKIGMFLDGLKSRGYVTFYEGIHLPDSALEVSCIDTLFRKFRKMVGVDPFYEFSKISLRRKGWIYQEAEMMTNVLNLSSDRDFNVDISIMDLIDAYEKSNGEIILDGDDLKYKLGSSEYKKRKASKSFHWIIVGPFSVRDKYLLNEVLNSEYEKIAIVYGSQHCGILKNALIHLHGYKICSSKLTLN